MRWAASAGTENIATWVSALRIRTGMVSTVPWIVCVGLAVSVITDQSRTCSRQCPTSVYPTGAEPVSDQLNEVPDLLGRTRADHHHGHPGGLPRGDLLTDVVDVADDRGVVDQLVGDDLGRLLFAILAI